MFRRFLKMSANIKTHTQYQGNNNNFTYNGQEYWINIHFLFKNQAATTKAYEYLYKQISVLLSKTHVYTISYF